MKRILWAESMKMQWSVVFVLIVADVWINSALGLMQMNDLRHFFQPNWSTLYMYAVNFHSMFFYPLYCGILASLICLYEHRNGAWKILLTLPISRRSFYMAKFLLLIGILALVQVVFLLGYLISGTIAKVEGTIDWPTLLYSIIGGWIGILPLAALQIWLSVKIKSFAAAQMFNVCCVVPNIVITGFHSAIGAWFPFSPPYYIMMPQTATFAPAVEPYSLFTIVLFTFIAYLLLGRRSFVRRDWI